MTIEREMAAPTKFGDEVKAMVWQEYRVLQGEHLEPTAKAVLGKVQHILDLQGHECPSYEWVQKEVKVIKKKDNENSQQKLLDLRFEWSRMDEYGLPWEASAYVLGMWKEFLRQFHIAYGIIPTARQAVWWWRIHLAAPKIDDPENLFYVANPFTVRELQHVILGRELEFSDLEAWLAYKPWESREHYLAYHQAIDYKSIRPLRERETLEVFYSLVTINEIRAGLPSLVGLSGIGALIPVGDWDECLELFPCQQDELWRRCLKTLEKPKEAIENGADIWQMSAA